MDSAQHPRPYETLYVAIAAGSWVSLWFLRVGRWPKLTAFFLPDQTSFPEHSKVLRPIGGASIHFFIRHIWSFLGHEDGKDKPEETNGACYCFLEPDLIYLRKHLVICSICADEDAAWHPSSRSAAPSVLLHPKVLPQGQDIDSKRFDDSRSSVRTRFKWPQRIGNIFNGMESML